MQSVLRDREACRHFYRAGKQRSARHKSGIAMRFPRISRLRWDKHPRDADRLEALKALLDRGREDGGATRRHARKIAAEDVLR
jgi:hypothetical protein